MRPSRLESGFRLVAGLFVLLALARPAEAEQTEKRIALVIGNAAYADGALPTTANDAGLIAQQLQAAGFDVSGARDLDGDSLRRAFRDFVEKAGQSGPDSVAVVYFAGYGLQFEGENYVVPVDARIPRAADVPVQAARISDLMRPLAGLPMRARIVVLDAARENPFAGEDQPLASGLALVEPDPGTLIAFNAAPGTVAPAEKGDSYGPYARALAEMMRQGGVPLKDVFDQVRLRVSGVTSGAVVPWDADRVDAPFLFFDRAPDAPTPPPNAGLSALRDRPLRELGAAEAYQAALDRDTIPAYQELLDAYPSDPMAKRVRALLAARREAATWRITLHNGTADAYWSYLRRYPRGPHEADCHRRLARLAVALEPPPDFQEIAYDLPPPPPEEIVIVDRPVLTFADPYFDLPPPPPVIVLDPPPPYFVDLPPPPPPVDVFVLPIPVYEPLPVWVEWPSYVAPPPVNIISYNIHNTVIVNTVQNTVIVKDPAGQPVPPFANAVAAGVLPRDAVPLLPGANASSLQAEPQVKPGAPRVLPGVGAALGAGAAAAALHVALPPSVAARAQQAEGPGVVGPNGRAPAPGQQAGPRLPAQARPGQSGASPGLPPGGSEHALPGQLQPGQQAAHPLPGQALPGQQPAKLPPGQISPLPDQARPGQPGLPPGGSEHALPGQLQPAQQAAHPLPGQALPGQQPAKLPPGQISPLPGQARPGQPGLPPGGPEHALPGQLQPGQQAAHPLPGQALPGQQPAKLPPGQISPLPGQARPGQPGLPPGGSEHALPGQLQPGQQAAHPLPGQALPGQQIQPKQGQPGQIRPAPLAPGPARPAVSEQQLQQQRDQQLQQQRAQQLQQQVQQQRAQQMQQQVQQQRAQQMQQQRAQQMQQQVQQQRAQQMQQQVQQQRAQQMQQQVQQQQRAQQMQQQRAQQMQQQVQQQRAQQMQQQVQQQRAQQMQQQVQQQRAQQMQQQVQQQRAQQMQIQMQRERRTPGPECGRPGQPHC